MRIGTAGTGRAFGLFHVQSPGNVPRTMRARRCQRRGLAGLARRGRLPPAPPPAGKRLPVPVGQGRGVGGRAGTRTRASLGMAATQPAGDARTALSPLVFLTRHARRPPRTRIARPAACRRDPHRSRRFSFSCFRFPMILEPLTGPGLAGPYLWRRQSRPVGAQCPLRRGLVLAEKHLCGGHSKYPRARPMGPMPPRQGCQQSPTIAAARRPWAAGRVFCARPASRWQVWLVWRMALRAGYATGTPLPFPHLPCAPKARQL